MQTHDMMPCDSVYYLLRGAMPCHGSILQVAPYVELDTVDLISHLVNGHPGAGRICYSMRLIVERTHRLTGAR